MKSFDERKFGSTISSVASMLLFLLFTVCMLIIISVAAGTYGRINSSREKSFGLSASLHYLTNKIKSADTVSLIDNGIVVENSGIACVIYYSDGGVYEKTIQASDIPEAKDGERIFKLDGMEIKEQDNLYRITVKSENDQCCAFVGKG